MVPRDKFLKVGVPLGWLGFPAVASNQLCFFRGYVSAFVTQSEQYLVDGVAINGVSGGPVFCESGKDSNDAKLAGMVSAYYPNRQSTGTLPGLVSVQDLTHLHDIVARFKNFDDAQRAKAKADAAAATTTDMQPASDPVPPSDNCLKPTPSGAG